MPSRLGIAISFLLTVLAILTGRANADGPGCKEQEINGKLRTRVDVSCRETPLRQVLEDLGNRQKINIVADEPALRGEGISLDRPVTVRLEGVSLQSALKLLLRPAGLTYVVKDEVVQVTTPEHAQGRLVRRIYSVGDLVRMP